VPSRLLLARPAGKGKGFLRGDAAPALIADFLDEGRATVDLQVDGLSLLLASGLLMPINLLITQLILFVVPSRILLNGYLYGMQRVRSCLVSKFFPNIFAISNF
jgi:hypothetical protein